MNRTTPADRDRAQRRVRAITAATAAAAGVLALGGAAAAAGTFSGRTVSSPQTNQPAATQDAGGLQQPTLPPGPGSDSGYTPITSGGS